MGPVREEGGAVTSYLQDDVSQQPQVSVPHGAGAHQHLRVVTVMPLIVDGHDDPAQTGVGH